MDKTDCHFYTPKRCRILAEILCKSGKCSFYKTTRQYEEDLQKYVSPFIYAIEQKNMEVLCYGQ